MSNLLGAKIKGDFSWLTNLLLEQATILIENIPASSDIEFLPDFDETIERLTKMSLSPLEIIKGASETLEKMKDTIKEAFESASKIENSKNREKLAKEKELLESSFDILIEKFESMEKSIEKEIKRAIERMDEIRESAEEAIKEKLDDMDEELDDQMKSLIKMTDFDPEKEEEIVNNNDSPKE